MVNIRMNSVIRNIQNKTNKGKTIFFISFMLQILLITIFVAINNLGLFLLALLVSYILDFIVFYKAYNKYYGDYFELLKIDYKGSVLLKQILLISFLSYREIITNSDIIVYCILIISNHYLFVH